MEKYGLAGGTVQLVTTDEEQCAASNSTYLVLVSSAFERQTWLYASMSWISSLVRTRFWNATPVTADVCRPL